MPRLLTMAVGRDPAPAPRSVKPVVETHPAPAAALATTAKAVKAPAAASLHDRLYRAWQACDWLALTAVARAHLAGSAPNPTLQACTRAAMAFFGPEAARPGPGDAERLLERCGEDALKAFAGGEGERERALLADDTLALQCLGLLGEASFDYVGALKASHALTEVLKARRPGAEARLSPGFVGHVGDVDIALPDWSFKIDICRHADSQEGWPSIGPVEDKLAVHAERKAARVTVGGRDLDAVEAGAAPNHPNPAEPIPRDPCDCTPREDLCSQPDECCATVNYYVADLLELRDWTHGYKAGDLAYIENIAAGETRSREHQMKKTRELFTETETIERTLEHRDFQVASRSSIQNEIERQKEASFDAEASATASYDAKAYSATISASASFARSSSEAIRQAQETAVETVKNAVSEVEKQTRVTRSERITTEETERNLHAFVNKGDAPLVTKYFYVDQMRSAQLYSYGRQLIAEFIVPSPARLYEKLVALRIEAQVSESVRAPSLKPPGELADLGVTVDELTPDNYEQWCAKYQVGNAPTPPAQTKQISGRLADATDRGDGEPIGVIPFDVPDGYEAVAMDLSGPTPEWLKPKKDPHKVEFNCAGDTLFWSKEESSPKTHSPLGHLTGSQSISVSAWYTDSFDAVVTISLQVLPSVMAEWRQAVFQLIKDKYDALVAAHAEAQAKYDDALAAYEAEKDALRKQLQASQTARNPFYNREAERTELKRAVIYLMCQDFSTEGAIIRKAAPCGLPEIDRGAAAAKGYEWYFWDRLIDWKRMAYAFFDYFWNPICDWPKRFDPDDPDPMFKAFKRAGYARVLVPVSPAMHRDFLWYITTHRKWGKKTQAPIHADDPRWRNVVFELEHAQDSAMTAREGHADVVNGVADLLIKGSDRYWKRVGQAGAPDPAMIALDIDRELIIEGEVYLVTGIALDANSPPFDPQNPDTLWWRVTLDRPYAGATGAGRLYSMGAQAVAPLFRFDVPTELIWAGAHDACLPIYPLPPCKP